MNTASARAAYVAAFCLFWGCNDQSGLKKVTTGSLEITGEFRFSKTQSGRTQTRTVTISNPGKESVILARFDHETSAGLKVSWRLLGPDGKVVDREGRGLPPALELDSGDRLRLSVTFKSDGPHAPRGRVIFQTNSGLDSQRKISLPIHGMNTVGELHASHNPIHFGRVVAGDFDTRTLTLTNFGTHTIRFDKLTVHGSNAFSIEVRGRDPLRFPEVLRDPDGDGTPGLTPDGQFDITVRFSPQDQRGETGELHISSTAHIPKKVIALVGNAAAPCVHVTPTSIRFPPTAAGAERIAMVRIESCGTEAVTIKNVSLVAGTEAYRLENAPAEPLTLPGTADGTFASPGIDLLVAFKPGETRAYTGLVRILTSDPERPEVDIELQGPGVDNRCPTPRILAEDSVVRPLEVITLDGSASTDPDGPQGRPVRYEWVIVDRPAGSTTQPVERLYDSNRPGDGGDVDAPETPQAQLFIDLAGEYTVELRVTDHFGARAPSTLCPAEPAQVRIKAVPDEMLHIELTWDTPSDRDQTDDEGTDIDLHLLHPEAQGWAQSDGLDCHYQNQSPDWGRRGDPRDDPTLDIDDVNGAGPENINLKQPELLGRSRPGYRVGAHYYSAEYAGGEEPFVPVASTARVRFSSMARSLMSARCCWTQPETSGRSLRCTSTSLGGM